MSEHIPTPWEQKEIEKYMTPERISQTQDREREYVANKIRNNYNMGVEAYDAASKRALRLLTLEPSFQKLLEKVGVKGLAVLDLACGPGNSSRNIRELGAAKIVGVDLSEEEIKKAKEQEEIDSERGHQLEKERIGIQYLVGDAAQDLGNIGQFDRVTAVMLLHYSESLQTLDMIIKNVKSHLKLGGYFLTTTANPDRVREGSDGYGVSFNPKPKKEGDQFDAQLSDFNGNKLFEIKNNFYWSKETYTRILEENGFEVEWISCEVSEDGYKKYGEEFWDAYKKNPVHVMIQAKLVKAA